MPLDFSHIRLPPAELRAPDEDLYREYIEVSEGASYVESDGEFLILVVSDGRTMFIGILVMSSMKLISALEVNGHVSGQGQSVYIQSVATSSILGFPEVGQPLVNHV